MSDRYLCDALNTAAQAIADDPRGLGTMREDDVRGEIYKALERLLPGRVRKERELAVESFRGVGPFDLLVDRFPGGPAAWLGEVKWSFGKRTKIFEAVWDAVKLCLAAEEHGATRCWLVTGAPQDHWATAECRELFAPGTLPFESCWDQPLIPTGPNGGATVGQDLLSGGRGNRFTRAPKAFSVDEVCHVDLRPEAENWSIRAIAVGASGGWLENFAPPPRFPARINQSWLDRHVPDMKQVEFEELIAWLQLKRWTQQDLATRVFPLRRSA